MPSTDPAPDDADGERSRRWFVRLLIGLAVGLPVAIEATTLFGLVRSRLLGGGEGESTSTTAAEPRGVGVGDELLPATDPPETLTDAVLEAGEATWLLTLDATVENTGEAPYEFRLGAVRTADGERVAGGATTGRIPPGEAVEVTARWGLPRGATPASVAVTGTTYGDRSARVTEQVRLAKVPVRQ